MRYTYNNNAELKDIINELKLGKVEKFSIYSNAGRRLVYDFDLNVAKLVVLDDHRDQVNPYYNPPVVDDTSEDVITDEVVSIDTEVASDEVTDIDDVAVHCSESEFVEFPNEGTNDDNVMYSEDATEVPTTLIEDADDESNDDTEGVVTTEIVDDTTSTTDEELLQPYIDRINVLVNELNDYEYKLHEARNELNAVNEELAEVNAKLDAANELNAELMDKLDAASMHEESITVVDTHETTDDLLDKLASRGYQVSITKLITESELK